MDCIFCKISNKEIPSKILYEDDLITIFMDANPIADGHTLIIPKKHYTDILEADDILSYMFKKAQEFTPQILNKLESKSMTYIINYGEAQQVKHLHLHMIPNYRRKNKIITKTIEETYDILKD